MRTMKRARGIVLICTLALLAFAPAAFAQGSVREGYDESGILQALEVRDAALEVRDAGQPREGDDPDPVSGSLAFTGLDVGILALMGAALLGTGVAVRRAVRNPNA